MTPVTQWVCGGFFILICGSYGYSTLLAGEQRTEKKEWRDEHNRILEKKLEGIESRQRSLDHDVHEEARRVDNKLDKINENIMKLLQERPIREAHKQ